MSKSFRSSFILVFVFLVMASFSTWGVEQSESVKQPLTHEVYDSWKSIYRPAISVDGQWVLYVETPQDGDAELVVLNAKSKQTFRHTIGYSGEGTDSERAANAVFSYDASHVIFLVSPTQEQIKKAKKQEDKKDRGKDDKPKKKLGIMDLADGKVTVVENVKSFRVPEEAGGWVAYNKEAEGKPEEKSEKNESEDDDEKKEKDYGTPMVLRSLKNGQEAEFAAVLDYRFTKNAQYLLFTVSSKENPETDGIFALKPGESNSNPLLTGKGKYSNLALDKQETRLAFLTDRDDQDSEEPTFNLYGWQLGSPQADKWVSHTSTPGFPQSMAVSDKSSVSFTEDGKMVLFGIKEIPPAEKESEDEEKQAKFELWHWNDPYPQPQQIKMEEQVRNNTWESIYFVDSQKFVKLADTDIPEVELAPSGAIAFAQTNWPYSKRVSYFGRYQDIYVIDPKTGKKTLVKKELYGGANLSPEAKYVYWFEENQWYVYDISSQTTINLTAALDVRFDREDWDTPNPARAYGIAGWTTNDVSILIYDRYDIWEIKPDGSQTRMITEGFGRKNDLSFRYLNLDPDERSIDPNQTLLLQTTNEETMASGFYTDRVNGSRSPQKLLMADKSYSPRTLYRPVKAKNVDWLIFSRSSFDEYPELWISDLELKNPQRLTNLGQQMQPYIWGKAELRDFLSADGRPLKGILVKPDNFDPQKKYPLMVYIYETLHQGLHSYRDPSPGSSINFPYYVSNGYVLWMPDIEYDTGYPGRDALKCVLPGIHMLIGEGYIDPKAVGIQGHSWGGYQISYMITQTNVFAAAEGGAPVSNMTSAYGGIRWGSGMVRQFQYEHTQSRLGDSLWNVPLRYIENSPLFWADKIQTPIMFMHNDQDGAVPWYQGIEFIMALRRLGKEAYMFNYNGEEHGLRKRVNQIDWTIRMAEFFDHHLKGTPMPDWMKNGIKAWEKPEKK